MSLFLAEHRRIDDIDLLRDTRWPQAVVFVCRFAPADCFGAEGPGPRRVFRTGTKLAGKWDPAEGRFVTDAPLIARISHHLEVAAAKLALDGNQLTVTRACADFDEVARFTQRMIYRLPLQLSLATGVAIIPIDLLLRIGDHERRIDVAGVPVNVKVTSDEAAAAEVRRGLEMAFAEEPLHPRLLAALFHHRQVLRLKADNFQLNAEAILHHLATAVRMIFGRRAEKAAILARKLDLNEKWFATKVLPLIAMEQRLPILPATVRPIDGDELTALRAFVVAASSTVSHLLGTLLGRDRETLAKIPPPPKDEAARRQLFDRFRKYCD